MQSVFSYILSKKAAGKPMLTLLLDPEKANLDEFVLTPNNQPDMLFVGGSTGSDMSDFVRTLKAKIKDYGLSIPIVLFPGNVSQFTPEADALLFLSLLSGRNPEMIVGQQIIAAQKVRKSGIETIPMGYILVDGGTETSVARVSETKPISQDDKDAIVATAVAAELMGKKVVYLEAGSGAKYPVSTQIIRSVRDAITVPLIVGGGIRDVKTMLAAYEAGADIVVVGNHMETHPEQLSLFVEAKNKEYTHSQEDKRFMSIALLEAQKAFEAGEVPIGCVIVSQNQIIGRGYNLTEMLQDVTAHAEMQALTAAEQTLGAKYLPDATLYVTVEPCAMCAGAIGWAQIKRVVFGAADDKKGFTSVAPHALHPKAKVVSGVMEDECSALVKTFFLKKR